MYLATSNALAIACLPWSLSESVSDLALLFSSIHCLEGATPCSFRAACGRSVKSAASPAWPWRRGLADHADGELGKGAAAYRSRDVASPLTLERVWCENG